MTPNTNELNMNAIPCLSVSNAVINNQRKKDMVVVLTQVLLKFEVYSNGRTCKLLKLVFFHLKYVLTN